MKKNILIGILSLLSGANASGHVWDELAILASNNGNGTFTLEKNAFLQKSTFTNAVFFDYNNDGNLDLLMMGQGGDWNISGNIKMVLLYKNLGREEGFRFEKVTDCGFQQYRDEGFFNPISTGDYNHDGYTDVVLMSHHDGRHIDVYLNDRGSGTFIRQKQSFEAATNGSVMWGDLNNDGWLDIEFSGQSDRTCTALKTYLNRKDGTFADHTPSNLSGAYLGQSSLGDINGDGTLDIITTGSNQEGDCPTSIYYNRISEAGGLPAYLCTPATECGILEVKQANPLIADFNADGKMDLILNGTPSNALEYRNRIYYQNEQGKFTLDTSYPLVPVNQDGGINMGDANGDGNMDIVVGGYIGNYDTTPSAYYKAPLRVYENRPEKKGLKGNTFPEAPGSLEVTAEDNELVIHWSDGADAETDRKALRYNLYVKNETTGELYTMIPVDIETGKLKVGTDLQTSLSSAVKNYRMSIWESGTYTVGVQTLDQSYAGSRFKTYTLQVTHTGQACIPDFKVTRNGKNIEVKGGRKEKVTVYSIDGQIISQGYTNQTIALPRKGTYIVQAVQHKEKIAF